MSSSLVGEILGGLFPEHHGLPRRWEVDLQAPAGASTEREHRFHEMLEAFVRSVLASAHATGGPLYHSMRIMGMDLGSKRFARNAGAILKRGSYENVLELIRVPTLFLSGEYDTLTPTVAAENMAREISGAAVGGISGADHMTPSRIRGA